MKKSILIFKVLFLSLVLIILPGCGKDSFEYEEHEGCVSLIKYTGNKNEFDIPESIDNKQVCSIQEYLFTDAMRNNKKIGTIPDNVKIGVFDYTHYGTKIYDYYDCEIEGGVVYFRNRVVNIHEDEVGEELIIREGTISLAYDKSLWYNDGKGIKFVYFPGSLKKISSYSFQHELLDVEVIYFGEGLEEIGIDAFKYCERIKHIYFPSTMKKIDASAFEKSPECLDIYLPDSIEELHFNSFGKGIIRISRTLDSIDWGTCWEKDGYMANFKIITEHNDQYLCHNCYGYKNEDYDGTGHKCVCE